MLVLRYLDLAETPAMKVEKIDFLKTKLASLAWKLFLYRINTVKAPRRQKATNGSGCGISRFNTNMRAHSMLQPRLSLFKSATSFCHFRNEKVLLPPGQNVSQATDPQSTRCTAPLSRRASGSGVSHLRAGVATGAL